MLKAVQNNPYRILGVYANSQKKEQIANRAKIMAFIRVNKNMTFKIDAESYIPECVRTQELLDYADSELTLSEGQIKHAQFWFLNKKPIDNIAFNHLFDGNIDKALEIWSKNDNVSSLQNRFICNLIQGNYLTAIHDFAIPLYNNFSDEFISEIIGQEPYEKNKLINNIIKVFNDEEIDLTKIIHLIDEEEWKSVILSARIDPLISKLDTLVAEAKAVNYKKHDERLKVGKNLKKEIEPIMDSLKQVINNENTRYKLIADKIAQEILQCAIDYYNGSDDYDRAAKALPLCEYANNLAMGETVKHRCEKNYEIIKNAYDRLPPKEVLEETKEIELIINKYKTIKQTSTNGLQLLKDARFYLTEIKDKLGKSHNHYLEISSLLGSIALDFVISEVNETFDEEERYQKRKKMEKEGGFGYSQYADPRIFFSKYGGTFSEYFRQEEHRKSYANNLKNVLKNAWTTILHIDLLDKTPDFISKRYNPNRESLHKMIDDVKGFDYPDGNYIIRGCAYSLRVDKNFLQSDSEEYSLCKKKADFKKYISNHPKGRHLEEAKTKLEQIEKRNQKTSIILVYIVIAALIAIIIALLNT